MPKRGSRKRRSVKRKSLRGGDDVVSDAYRQQALQRTHGKSQVPYNVEMPTSNSNYLYNTAAYGVGVPLALGAAAVGVPAYLGYKGARYAYKKLKNYYKSRSPRTDVAHFDTYREEGVQQACKDAARRGRSMSSMYNFSFFKPEVNCNYLSPQQQDIYNASLDRANEIAKASGSAKNCQSYYTKLQYCNGTGHGGVLKHSTNTLHLEQKKASLAKEAPAPKQTAPKQTPAAAATPAAPAAAKKNSSDTVSNVLKAATLVSAAATQMGKASAAKPRSPEENAKLLKESAKLRASRSVVEAQRLAQSTQKKEANQAKENNNLLKQLNAQRRERHMQQQLRVQQQQDQMPALEENQPLKQQLIGPEGANFEVPGTPRGLGLNMNELSQGGTRGRIQLQHEPQQVFNQEQLDQDLANSHQGRFGRGLTTAAATLMGLPGTEPGNQLSISAGITGGYRTKNRSSR